MKYLPLFLILILALSACQEPIDPNSCEDIVRSNRQFDKIDSDEFSLVSAEIRDDCLYATVQHGGGCGGADFDLIASEGETLSSPPQISMRLVLDNRDMCLALITAEYGFDLQSIQREGGGTVIFNLE
ncbi:MAG: hypothetical protein AAFP02_26465, partial [Bacteroidota bacterium]